jgi:serine/threonine protein kinase
VDVSSITPEKASTLPLEKRVEILATLAHSLRLLHMVRIVHGDLKPANILVKRTDAGFLAAKLIDFDDSYEAGSPPTPEEIVGDQLYYSPELLRYVTVDTEDSSAVAAATADLGLSSDIFSLGLIFHEYLVGRLPAATSGAYLCEAVTKGERVRVSEEIPERLKSLIAQMIAHKATDRPTIERVFTEVRDSLRGSKTSSDAREHEGASAPKLTINLAKKPALKAEEPPVTVKGPATSPPIPGPAGGRLVINMGKKK